MQIGILLDIYLHRNGGTESRMKAGVVSDTHLRGMTPDFQRIYEQYLSPVDMILHAGDIVSVDVVDILGKGPFPWSLRQYGSA